MFGVQNSTIYYCVRADNDSTTEIEQSLDKQALVGDAQKYANRTAEQVDEGLALFKQIAGSEQPSLDDFTSRLINAEIMSHEQKNVLSAKDLQWLMQGNNFLFFLRYIPSINIGNTFAPFVEMLVNQRFDVARAMLKDPMGINFKEICLSQTAEFVYLMFADDSAGSLALASSLFNKDNINKLFVGNTPLHRAASRGCKQLVQQLLQQGADVNKLGVDGHLPLYYAAGSNGSVEVVKVLLETTDLSKIDQQKKRELLERFLTNVTQQTDNTVARQFAHFTHRLLQQDALTAEDISPLSKHFAPLVYGVSKKIDVNPLINSLVNKGWSFEQYESSSTNLLRRIFELIKFIIQIPYHVVVYFIRQISRILTVPFST